jgi:hypothetical protein
MHTTILSIECPEGKYEVNKQVPPDKKGVQEPLFVEFITTEQMLDGADDVVDFFRVLCTFPKEHKLSLQGVGAVIDKNASEVGTVVSIAPLSEMHEVVEDFKKSLLEDETEADTEEDKQPEAGFTNDIPAQQPRA